MPCRSGCVAVGSLHRSGCELGVGFGISNWFGEVGVVAGVPSRLGEVGAGVSSRFGEVGVGVSVPTAIGLQRSESASASLVGLQRSKLGSASSADVVAWRGRAGREVIVDVGPFLPYFFDCNSGRVARYGTRREAALSILLYLSVNQRVHGAPGSRSSVAPNIIYECLTSSLNDLTLLITE